MRRRGSLLWFARHELRLSWRDTLSMMTAGRRGREKNVAIGVLVFLGILHFVAWCALGRAGAAAVPHDLSTRIAVTVGIGLALSAMLSQAMESVTRTFYSRSDLELILSSPARANKLFAVRLGAIALSVSAMSLLLMGPFINVLIFEGGAKWFGAYGVIVAVAFTATALGAMMTVGLFHLIGPKRTRFAAQVGAAIIGGVFVIGLQFAALFSTGTMSRAAVLKSHFVVAHAPTAGSVWWLPARAALGDGTALEHVLGASALLLLATILMVAPRFGRYAVAASSVALRPKKAKVARSFKVQRTQVALRHKELMLLIRDPWLMSQSLMQILYLLPPAALLCRSFSTQGSARLVLVPVLIMAAGQLAGGLAWLTISGEDAPDLVQTAPVSRTQLWRAKIEAVLECVAVVFAPFLLGLLFLAPELAVIATLGITASAASAAAIQFWFRAQAKRSQFRRRHTSSRIATFSEAFSSITWAAAGAIAAAGSWLASIVALIALGIVAITRLLSPAKATYA